MTKESKGHQKESKAINIQCREKNDHEVSQARYRNGGNA